MNTIAKILYIPAVLLLGIISGFIAWLLHINVIAFAVLVAGTINLIAGFTLSYYFLKKEKLNNSPSDSFKKEVSYRS
ncbi:TPA: hypothetical protein EYP66_10910 [Candidatus Poribacteria bacterium]|nr:hypothetical protein [Candidatus Poribacteria bacterium]